MGWASRWLRGLLGGKKSAEGGTTAENKPLKEKKRWGFGKSFRERDKAQQRREWLAKAAAGEASSEPRKGSYRETRRTYFGGSPARSGSLADEDEQSKRAIAVAAATAAVAEAAVAAAQAAAAVVRLTSSGRSLGFRAVGSMKREDWAALKIQAAFRGYLARRALKALKGLVKLQALVRGNIVRKQAAETLRCMQALVRVQARARACRAIRSETSRSSKSSHSIPGPPTPEKYESAIRSSASKPNRSRSLKRTSSKKTRMDAANKDRNHSSNWNWLDQWMEGGYCDTQQVSRVMDDDKHTKILEVDTGKPPQFNSRQRSNPLPSSCPQTKSDESSRTAAIIPDSPSKDSTTAQLSIPSQSSPVDRHESLSPLRFPNVEFVDMGESPHFFSASSRPGSSRTGPFTPAKSECSRSLFSSYSDYPNYMAYTESSRAKARSQSAPKQRPECEKSSSVKRLSSHGSGRLQTALTQRSSMHAKFANKAYPGSGRLDQLGMPMRM